MLLRSITLVVVVLALAACQSESVPVEGAAPVPAAAGIDSGPVTLEVDNATDVPEAEPPTAQLGEFRIVSVLLGTELAADKAVAADTEVFTAKDSIYASVLSTGAHQGLRISAKWLAPDGATIAETVQPMVPTAATAVTFKISNSEGWAVGEYQLLIGINGATLRTRKFQVR